MTTSSEETINELVALSDNLAAAVERAGRSVVAVHARRGTASSGVHWRPGIVVTADHSIQRDDKVSVAVGTDKKVPASVAGRDASTDIAVLKVEGIDLPVAEIGDPDELSVGHIVLAVARPGEAGLSTTMGVLSALTGPWRTWSGGQIDQFIRPDLTFYPGFSGGPLIDARGRVIGINTSGLSRSMGVAIPSSTVNRVADQLVSRGRIARGYLGLGMQPVRLPDNLLKSLGLSGNQGLVVVSVESGGPAEQSGVLVGDIVAALDGERVGDAQDVQALLDPDRVGKPVHLGIIRGGTWAELTVTVGERPERRRGRSSDATG